MRTDHRADGHANNDMGSPELLQEFRRLNPQLQEATLDLRCPNLYGLLTSRHRHESHSYCPETTLEDLLNQCFLEHREQWSHRPTGRPVLVAHPYCEHTPPPGETPRHREIHRSAGERLAQKGLVYLASRGSWYCPGRTTLIVIARADIAQTITLPSLPDQQDTPKPPDTSHLALSLDVNAITQAKLRQEAPIRERLARQAQQQEQEGNTQLAFMFLCDTAYIDRQAGFHHHARRALEDARRLLDVQPWLDQTFLYFHNETDRRYICGQGARILSPSALETLLSRHPLPTGWEPFAANGNHGADSRIHQGNTQWGFAQITQGGTRQLWAANVSQRHGSTVSSVAGDNPQRLGGPKTNAYRTPQEAVHAAIDIWSHFQQLEQEPNVDHHP